VDITAEKLQFFLETAWNACPASANSLRDQMFFYETSVRNVSRGGTIGSVSKNGASHSYRGPGLGQYTPDQLGDAWRMLINAYDDTLAQFREMVQYPPTNPPAWWPVAPADGDWDEQIFNRLSCVLRQSVTEYQIDLSYLRLRPTLPSTLGVQTW
jgi:hypothetical protein